MKNPIIIKSVFATLNFISLLLLFSFMFAFVTLHNNASLNYVHDHDLYLDCMINATNSNVGKYNDKIAISNSFHFPLLNMEDMARKSIVRSGELNKIIEIMNLVLDEKVKYVDNDSLFIVTDKEFANCDNKLKVGYSAEVFNVVNYIDIYKKLGIQIKRISFPLLLLFSAISISCLMLAFSPTYINKKINIKGRRNEVRYFVLASAFILSRLSFIWLALIILNLIRHIHVPTLLFLPTYLILLAFLQLAVIKFLFEKLIKISLKLAYPLIKKTV